MNIDHPAVSNILRRSMIARIATLSRTGRPSINPLYFVYLDNPISGLVQPSGLWRPVTSKPILV